VFVLLGVVAWATIGTSTRLVQTDTASMIFWRSLFGGTATFALLLAINGRHTPRVFGRLRGPGLAIIALSAIGTVLFQVALRMGSVADVAVIYASLPLTAALLGWLLLRQTTRFATLVASVAALAGVAVTAGGGLADGRILGVAIAGIMTGCYAGVILLLNRHSDLPVLAVVSSVSLCVALLMLPWADPARTPPSDILVLALFGILQVGFADSVFSRGSQLVPPIHTALIGTLEAPLSSALAWVMVAEAPSSAALAGGAIVIVAVVGSLTWNARTAPAGAAVRSLD
jgi:drug/metabolite transporter (DMT)-like permease